jgi:hypothetical protein
MATGLVNWTDNRCPEKPKISDGSQTCIWSFLFARELTSGRRLPGIYVYCRAGPHYRDRAIQSVRQSEFCESRNLESRDCGGERQISLGSQLSHSYSVYPADIFTNQAHLIGCNNGGRREHVLAFHDLDSASAAHFQSDSR